MFVGPHGVVGVDIEMYQSDRLWVIARSGIGFAFKYPRLMDQGVSDLGLFNKFRVERPPPCVDTFLVRSEVEGKFATSKGFTPGFRVEWKWKGTLRHQKGLLQG